MKNRSKTIARIGAGVLWVAVILFLMMFADVIVDGSWAVGLAIGLSLIVVLNYRYFWFETWKRWLFEKAERSELTEDLWNRTYMASLSGDFGFTYRVAGKRFEVWANVLLPPEGAEVAMRQMGQRLKRALPSQDMAMKQELHGAVVGYFVVEFTRKVATKANLKAVRVAFQPLLDSEYKGFYYAHWQVGGIDYWVKMRAELEAYVIRRDRQTWRWNKSMEPYESASVANPDDPNLPEETEFFEEFEFFDLPMVEDLQPEDLITEEEWQEACMAQ